MVITAHSAFAYSALFRAARLWNDPQLSHLIEEHFNLFLKQHTSLTGKIYHRSVHGEVKYPGDLDDHAFLIDALIELYQLSFNPLYLAHAAKLQTHQDLTFFNIAKKSYRFSNEKNPLDLRNEFVKIGFKVPSGQAMSYNNLLRLSAYFQNKKWNNQASDLIDSYPDILKTNPLHHN